mmetsp:Transcript_22733/g.62791  ORF Transcript_22733/g.62791 Transcript_22733/m.62791 type:complete len:242 (-) Transcript_22733:90-815(-)
MSVASLVTKLLYILHAPVVPSYSCSTHRLATALQALRLCPSMQALAEGPNSTASGTEPETVVEGKEASVAAPTLIPSPSSSITNCKSSKGVVLSSVLLSGTHASPPLLGDVPEGQVMQRCSTLPSRSTIVTIESAAPESQEQEPPVPEAGVHSWVRAKPFRKRNKEPDEESQRTQERWSAEGTAPSGQEEHARREVSKNSSSAQGRWLKATVGVSCPLQVSKLIIRSSKQAIGVPLLACCY